MHEGERLIIKDLTTGKIIETSFKKSFDLPFKDVPDKISKLHFIAYVLCFVCMLGTTVCICFRLYSEIDFGIISLNRIGILVLYSILQIVCHELGHFFAFKYMGRKPDSFGFIMNYYVFPAFYVRMNDCHLLSRSERFVVHTSGLLINSINTFGIYFVSGNLITENLRFAVFWYSMAMLYNCLPILGSDGFKALLAVANETEKRNFKDNSIIVKTTVIVSYVVAIFYGICNTLAVIKFVKGWV